MFVTVAGIMAFRHFWAEAVAFVVLSALYVLTLVWRVRSGISTWT